MDNSPHGYIVQVEQQNLAARFVATTPLYRDRWLCDCVVAALIKRNTTIVIKTFKVFWTSDNNQPGVSTRLFEGERACSKDNKLRGKSELNGGYEYTASYCRDALHSTIRSATVKTLIFKQKAHFHSAYCL